MEITRALLGVVAPSGGYRALSDLQRRALKAIETHGQWDRNGDAIVNFSLGGNAYGLPSELEDFLSFVQAAEAAARGETVDWKPWGRPKVRERVDPEVAAQFVILFAVPLVLWLVIGVLDQFLLPKSPYGWGWLSFLTLGLGVSIYFLRRLSSPRM